MKPAAAMLSVMALVLAGCAAPFVEPKPPTFQPEADHVADWGRLADRSAFHFAAQLDGNMPAVFVAPGPADMPFAASYRNLLEQALFRRGFRVQETAAGAVVFRFDVQTFLYRNNVWSPVGHAGLVTIPFAVALDLVDPNAYDITPAEVALTLTVTDGTRLLFRDSETAYIHPTELPFYWTHMPDFVPQATQPDLAVVDLPVHPASR